MQQHGRNLCATSICSMLQSFIEGCHLRLDLTTTCSAQGLTVLRIQYVLGPTCAAVIPIGQVLEV